MTNKHGECSLEAGSVTQAMRIQEALASAAIPSRVIKTNSSRHGCIYGISFSCAQENNVRTVLSIARIPVKRWETEDEL